MYEFPTNAYAEAVDWSAVVANGPDATRFVQGFCTNDLARLPAGSLCEAFFTDVKARVLAYAWVGPTEQGVIALLTSGRAAALRDHLDKYLIRERVELSTVEQGALLARTEPPLETPLERLTAPPGCFGEGLTVLLGGATGPGALDQPCRDAGLEKLSADGFDRLRLLRGVPLDGVDVDQRNLPQEVDRNEQAISFTKGCYLGQEPVARIDALGRVQWLLRGLRVEGVGPVGWGDEALADGRAVGRVTSSIADGSGVCCLAYLRREHAEPGKRLEVDGRPAVVCGLPFPQH